ncbi:hypothetical protein Cgig2_006704 [Carnegiea gigantea]|uniref:Uncharacterized protein n=1 Tax=Carnegiea gigantea TaxID=171969 RepID=A0A9Q1JS90_9CARY|nr:hypothetical protein Cgig2_006704 [Carnegiea gigantea]
MGRGRGRGRPCLHPRPGINFPPRSRRHPSWGRGFFSTSMRGPDRDGLGRDEIELMAIISKLRYIKIGPKRRRVIWSASGNWVDGEKGALRMSPSSTGFDIQVHTDRDWRGLHTEKFQQRQFQAQSGNMHLDNGQDGLHVRIMSSPTFVEYKMLIEGQEIFTFTVLLTKDYLDVLLKIKYRATDVGTMGEVIGLDKKGGGRDAEADVSLKTNNNGNLTKWNYETGCKLREGGYFENNNDYKELPLDSLRLGTT